MTRIICWDKQWPLLESDSEILILTELWEGPTEHRKFGVARSSIVGIKRSSVDATAARISASVHHCPKAVATANPRSDRRDSPESDAQQSRRTRRRVLVRVRTLVVDDCAPLFLVAIFMTTATDRPTTEYNCIFVLVQQQTHVLNRNHDIKVTGSASQGWSSARLSHSSLFSNFPSLSSCIEPAQWLGRGASSRFQCQWLSGESFKEQVKCRSCTNTAMGFCRQSPSCASEARLARRRYCGR
jgi:hypothetical protein